MKGLITAPKKLKSAGIRRLMEDAPAHRDLEQRLNPVRGAMGFRQTTPHTSIHKWLNLHDQIYQLNQYAILY
jgi:hypothetical protein